MIRNALLALLSAIICTGCATMFARQYDEITIKTEPPGAKVYEGAELLGTTPLTHRFERDTFADTKLHIRKADYITQQVRLNRTIEKKALYNLGFITTTFGATSWGIDAATGALIRYHPNSYFIELEPINDKPDGNTLNRLNRSRFVLLNYDLIKRDMARGGGEYLWAYYSMLDGAPEWDVFMERVYGRMGNLLARSDAVDFYRSLEASQKQ